MSRTISWEDAILREHDYRRKIRNIIQQHPDDSDVLQSQILPSDDANIVGIKRSASSLDLHNQDHLLKDLPSLSQKRRYQMPEEHDMHEQRPSLIQQWNSQPSLLNNQLPLPQSRCQKTFLESQEGPRQQQIFGQQVPPKLHQKFWCNLCKVDCVTPHNLRNHRQGKKHKSKLEAVFLAKKKTQGSSEIFWCNECKIPCMNKLCLTQHLLGKKHQACTANLESKRSNNISASCVDVKIEHIFQAKDLHQAENSERTSLNGDTTTLAMQPTRPMLQNQRLNISNWSNCR